jgi:hypothetical protein
MSISGPSGYRRTISGDDAKVLIEVQFRPSSSDSHGNIHPDPAAWLKGQMCARRHIWSKFSSRARYCLRLPLVPESRLRACK